MLTYTDTQPVTSCNWSDAIKEISTSYTRRVTWCRVVLQSLFDMKKPETNSSTGGCLETGQLGAEGSEAAHEVTQGHVAISLRR